MEHLTDAVTTKVLADIDHVEWHRGVKDYGFWCIKIEDGAWLERLNKLESAFRPHLQANYQRFFHVTIATVGLMDSDKWKTVERQMRLLHRANDNNIELCWRGVASYAHCPIVSVYSAKNGVSKIRKLLHSISQGDDSHVFEPHITLGYYAKEVTIDNLETVAGKSNALPLDSLIIKKIQFCTYETHNIKGPITSQFNIAISVC
ncbi:hypothetical protein CW745_09515 [Psychromonas sp. psych-6C06]|uniref:hypothetical protein n=1 Tax=Psychromonas sp. psych-6C06 TaxID=2058089 RepID=UPI000C32F09F|nr:hypothetical protein [Psychromonas sp. psych-6C06]PKF61560.1 hypothetical protein CW745_09515 [Psychromonas sp. psych-6C06]